MPIHCLLFIQVVTPLHNGSGESLGVVDREIMRERTTGFPIVQATSLKGVLREEFRQNCKPQDVQALFGPDPGSSGDHAGAVSFGDSQVLAFPVRSLKGPWVWITSPLVLTRFFRRLRLAGQSLPGVDELTPQLWGGHQGSIICPDAAGQILVNGQLLLEEFPFQPSNSSELATLARALAPIIYPEDQYLQEAMIQRLVLLSDDDFTYFVRQATEVTPNIRIDGATGTTDKGSLRYTEYLPMETVLYSLVTFNKRRIPENREDNCGGRNLDSEEQIYIFFRDNVPDFIQLGGDETTGKGVVALQPCTSQEVATHA